MEDTAHGIADIGNILADIDIARWGIAPVEGCWGGERSAVCRWGRIAARKDVGTRVVARGKGVGCRSVEGRTGLNHS